MVEFDRFLNISTGLLNTIIDQNEWQSTENIQNWPSIVAMKYSSICHWKTCTHSIKRAKHSIKWPANISSRIIHQENVLKLICKVPLQRMTLNTPVYRVSSSMSHKWTAAMIIRHNILRDTPTNFLQLNTWGVRNPYWDIRKSSRKYCPKLKFCI